MQIRSHFQDCPRKCWSKCWSNVEVSDPIPMPHSVPPNRRRRLWPVWSLFQNPIYFPRHHYQLQRRRRMHSTVATGLFFRSRAAQRVLLWSIGLCCHPNIDWIKIRLPWIFPQHQKYHDGRTFQLPIVRWISRKFIHRCRKHGGFWCRGWRCWTETGPTHFARRSIEVLLGTEEEKVNCILFSSCTWMCVYHTGVPRVEVVHASLQISRQHYTLNREQTQQTAILKFEEV